MVVYRFRRVNTKHIIQRKAFFKHNQNSSTKYKIIRNTALKKKYLILGSIKQSNIILGQASVAISLAGPFESCIDGFLPFFLWDRCKSFQ